MDAPVPGGNGCRHSRQPCREGASVAQNPKPRWTVYNGIALTVTAVWTFANVVSVIDPSRPVSPLTQGIMGVVASAFFGAGVVADVRRRRNGNGKDDDA